MNLNLENMKDVFGDEIIEIMMENIDIIEENISTLKELQFDDVEGLLERCPDVFMYFPEVFKEKVNKLINTIGENYVEIIENDISYFENL